MHNTPGKQGPVESRWQVQALQGRSAAGLVDPVST
jgi:hypothetical protein